MPEDNPPARAIQEDELLRLLAENAIDYAIFVMDLERRVLTWTLGAERLLQYDREEILGCKADLFYTPEDAANDVPQQEIEAALAKGRGEDDRWHIRKDGSQFWASGVLVPLWDERRALRGFAKIMRDRTDWKLAEQARKETEGRLHALLDRLPQGAVYQAKVDPTDQRVRFTYVSAGVKEICGLEPEEVLADGAVLYDCIHQEDRPRVQQAEADALRTMGRFRCEFRLRTPAGLLRWLQCQSAPHRLESGEIVWEGVMMDVTHRKTTELDLRFLNEASHSLATLVDYESTLQKVAGLAVPHFADWCTVYLPESHGKLRQLAIAHADPSKVQLAMELAERWPSSPNTPGGPYEVFRTGRAVLAEEVRDDVLQQAARDQQHLEALRELGLKSYMCMPLAVRDATIGVITFFAAESGRRYTTADLAIAEDLAHRAAIATENARLYEELQEEGRRKDEFLAMLAHELRNPLAPIRSGIDLLGMMDVDTEILGTMQQQVEHLTRLVDDLLDVSRVMRGRVELRREPVELSSTVARAADTMRPMIEMHQQELTVTIAPEPVWLSADSVRLTQVIINLLNNASKYTEPGGKIWLSAESQAQGQTPGVLIRVEDTGIGIDADTLPHVFGLFTQADRTLDRSQGGLGIGLTIVKSMVEAHQGSVAVRSDGPNKGSEFTVWLPTSPAPHQPLDGVQEQTATAAAHRILIVDDNVPAAKMLGLLLTKMGDHRVFHAYDGSTALEAADRHRPDIILLDIGLPMMDGFEVVRKLRARPKFRRTLIVALTGYGTEDDRRRALQAGFDQHLIKPPRAQDLQTLLNCPPPYEISP